MDLHELSWAQRGDSRPQFCNSHPVFRSEVAVFHQISRPSDDGHNLLNKIASTLWSLDVPPPTGPFPRGICEVDARTEVRWCTIFFNFDFAAKKGMLSSVSVIFHSEKDVPRKIPGNKLE